MTAAKVVEVPEWLAVGSEVAEIRGGFTSTITSTTVQRHTATRVVLENGHWYRKQDGDRWTRSEGGTWGSTYSLVAPDHERAKAVLNQQRVDQASGSVGGAYEAWRREHNQGAGANLVLAVEYWQSALVMQENRR